MTRKELEQVYFLTKELKLWEKKLRELDEVSIKSPMPTGMPFANTNAISDPTAEAAMKEHQYQEAVRTFLEALQIRKRSIDLWVMTLDDSYLRQIIHYHCYELYGWEKIGKLMKTSPDSVRLYYYRKIPKE